MIPYALREKPGADFAILVSPPGVNPHEQVAFFLHNQVGSWGLSEADVAKADAMHQATALYYAGRLDHSKAQAEVDSHKTESWFKKVVTHPYWDEMTPDGRILTPAELNDALAKRPGAFEIYSSESSFEEYAPVYEALTVPTLIVYGSADELVPIKRSRAVIEPALQKSGAACTIKVFDGADHDIQTPDGHVRQDYLDLMVDWTKAQFGKKAASSQMSSELATPSDCCCALSLTGILGSRAGSRHYDGGYLALLKSPVIPNGAEESLVVIIEARNKQEEMSRLARHD